MRSLEKIDLKIRWFQEKIAEYQVRLQDLQKKRTAHCPFLRIAGR